MGHLTEDLGEALLLLVGQSIENAPASVLSDIFAIIFNILVVLAVVIENLGNSSLLLRSEIQLHLQCL